MKNKEPKVEALAKRLQVIGDPCRIKIICLLLDQKKLCVSDLAKVLDLSVATASHHLQILAREGILDSDRDGKNICYAMSSDGKIADLKRLICKYR